MILRITHITRGLASVALALPLGGCPIEFGVPGGPWAGSATSATPPPSGPYQVISCEGGTEHVRGVVTVTNPATNQHSTKIVPVGSNRYAVCLAVLNAAGDIGLRAALGGFGETATVYGAGIRIQVTGALVSGQSS